MVVAVYYGYIYGVWHSIHKDSKLLGSYGICLCFGRASDRWIFTFCLASCQGPKKQGFGPKIDCIQMKLPNFVNPFADKSPKIGHDFSNKMVQKLKLSNNCFYKKYAPKLVLENSLWESDFDTFWQPVSALTKFTK